MVAIFSGAGTGLERGSGGVLGAAGLLGSAAQGRGGSQFFLNAANGNLVITRQDEFLSGRGQDAAVNRTYNSLGDMTDDSADNWRMGSQRSPRNLSGAVNSWGSSVRRIGADGAIITYGWNGSAYVTTDGAGAHDKITYDGTWRWHDGDSGTTEVYGGPGNQLSQVIDRSGNAVTYNYSGNNLHRITTADGGYLEYGWSGNNITQVTSVSHGAVATRTRYSYDGYNRLSSVTVDLSPGDNSVGDGNVYTTNYTYHGAWKLIATISETDGSHLAIGYDGHNRVTSPHQHPKISPPSPCPPRRVQATLRNNRDDA